MEIAAVAQRYGQEHLQSILVSGVAAEPHYADNNVGRAKVTNDRDDIPEDTSYCRNSSHSCGSRDLRHNELQERYQMKHNGHLMDVLTDTKSLTYVLMPPDPQHMGCSPIAHANNP